MLHRRSVRFRLHFFWKNDPYLKYCYQSAQNRRRQSELQYQTPFLLWKRHNLLYFGWNHIQFLQFPFPEDHRRLLSDRHLWKGMRYFRQSVRSAPLFPPLYRGCRHIRFPFPFFPEASHPSIVRSRIFR